MSGCVRGRGRLGARLAVAGGTAHARGAASIAADGRVQTRMVMHRSCALDQAICHKTNYRIAVRVITAAQGLCMTMQDHYQAGSHGPSSPIAPDGHGTVHKDPHQAVAAWAAVWGIGGALVELQRLAEDVELPDYAEPVVVPLAVLLAAVATPSSATAGAAYRSEPCPACARGAGL